MRRAAALAIIVASVAALQQFGGEATTFRTFALALGFALIAASLLGDVAERLRLPRMSGYLVFGLLCGPFMLNLITASMARELQLVNGLAIALIAFVAGLELNFAHLRPRLRSVLIVGTLSLFGSMAVITLVLWAAWPWLPLGDAGGPLARLTASIVTAALVVSFSPTVTIAVIAESRARGAFTELVMAIVVLSDLLLILVFALAMQAARWTSGTAASDVHILVYLSWEVIASLAFGALVGALFAFYLKAVNRELTLALLAVCAVIAGASPALHVELILAALAAGLVVENIAPPRGDALKEAVERGALPVLIVFFAAAGASLQLDALAIVGTTAVGLALLRLALIRGFAYAGTRIAAVPPVPGGWIWMGLISQAGVTLGLATIVAAEFPGWGTAVQTLVVALTALHVLTGPIAFKAALARAGEIGRLDEPESAES
jgi:Kef-type K+ transport system membrane component KefB